MHYIFNIFILLNLISTSIRIDKFYGKVLWSFGRHNYHNQNIINPPQLCECFTQSNVTTTDTSKQVSSWQVAWELTQPETSPPANGLDKSTNKNVLWSKASRNRFVTPQNMSSTSGALGHAVQLMNRRHTRGTAGWHMSSTQHLGSCLHEYVYYMIFLLRWIITPYNN